MGKLGEALSAERRQKISESQRRRHLKLLKERKAETEPTHRRCPKCKTTKPIEDFGTRKQTLKCGVVLISPRSSCRRCEAKRVADWKAQKIAEGTWPELRKRSEANRDPEKAKRYQREWHAAKRRERGVKSSGRTPDVVEKRLSAKPIAEFLTEIDCPATLPGVETRRLYAITHGEQEHVTLGTIDSILLALDCPEKLHELYPDPKAKSAGYQVLDPNGLLNSQESGP